MRRLLEYEKFKRAADVLYEKGCRDRARDARTGLERQFEAEEETLVEASLFELVSAFKELIEERKRVQPFRVDAYRVSSERGVQALLDIFRETPVLRFTELFRLEATKEESIVAFLALLELARMRAVRVLQRIQSTARSLRSRDGTTSRSRAARPRGARARRARDGAGGAEGRPRGPGVRVREPVSRQVLAEEVLESTPRTWTPS